LLHLNLHPEEVSYLRAMLPGEAGAHGPILLRSDAYWLVPKLLLTLEEPAVAMLRPQPWIRPVPHSSDDGKPTAYRMIAQQLYFNWSARLSWHHLYVLIWPISSQRQRLAELAGGRKGYEVSLAPKLNIDKLPLVKSRHWWSQWQLPGTWKPELQLSPPFCSPAPPSGPPLVGEQDWSISEAIVRKKTNLLFQYAILEYIDAKGWAHLSE